MKYRTRNYYSDSQKALMWERWRQGQTLHQIAALFDRRHTSVQHILARHGGIRPPERGGAQRHCLLPVAVRIAFPVVGGRIGIDSACQPRH